MRLMRLLFLLAVFVICPSCGLKSVATAVSNSTDTKAEDPVMAKGCDLLFMVKEFTNIAKFVREYPKDKFESLRASTKHNYVQFSTNHPECANETHNYLRCMGNVPYRECNEWLSTDKYCGALDNQVDPECAERETSLRYDCIDSMVSNCSSLKTILDKCEERNKDELTNYRVMTQDLEGSIFSTYEHYRVLGLDRDYGWENIYECPNNRNDCDKKQLYYRVVQRLITYDLPPAINKVLLLRNYQLAKTATTEEIDQIKSFCIREYGRIVEETENITDEQKAIIDALVKKSCVDFFTDFPACRIEYMLYDECIIQHRSDPTYYEDGSSYRDTCVEEADTFNSCSKPFHYEIEAYFENHTNLEPDTIHEVCVYPIYRIQFYEEALGKMFK
ncbi:MAG: hypothetical protein J6A01_08095 [Proteobacteria bacterium]|nr:hypothetical protein [Pseudomonadota bacterium]